jgi:tetratricopeptide (TPR) repeat protein
MKVQSIFVVVTMAMIALPGALVAQVKSIRQADSIEYLIQQEEWKKAEQTILRLKITAHQRDMGRGYFIHGYLYHSMADAAPDSASRTAYLHRATEQYLQALTVDRKNSATKRNLALAYHQLGDTKQAIAHLRQSFKWEGQSATALALGDLYLQTGIPDSAFHYYELVVKNNPGFEQAQERVVIALKFLALDGKKVFELCQSMIDHGLYEMSSRALVDFIGRNYQTHETESVRALLWWVSLLGKGQTADVDPVRVFRMPWKHPALQELLGCWSDPLTIQNLSWWRTSEKMHIVKDLLLNPPEEMTAALLTLGEELLKRGSIKESQQVLESAYKLLTNHSPHLPWPSYRIPDVFYEASGNLGMLYAKYPETDREGSKFKNLEEQLFGGKGGAYFSGNTNAIAKFHTTLGLIYASKNQWEHGARGGFFQLEQAIKRSPHSGQLGHLQLLLVEGQLKTNNAADARKTLLDAAMSYLNVDNLLIARRCLERYTSLEGANTVPYGRIKSILSFRMSLDSMPREEVVQKDLAITHVNGITEFITGVPSDFLAFQRFKIFSDLGDRCSDGGQAGVALAYYAQAVTQAYKLDVLGSYEDIFRINRQQAAVQDFVRWESFAEEYLPIKTKKKPAHSKQWQVRAPGNNYHTDVVEFPMQLLTASRLAGAIVSQVGYWRTLHLELKSSNNKLVVYFDEGQNEAVVKSAMAGALNSINSPMGLIMIQQ